MVFYFTCEYKDPGGEPYIVYMGADKYENEGLIEWGQTRCRVGNRHCMCRGGDGLCDGTGTSLTARD